MDAKDFLRLIIHQYAIVDLFYYHLSLLFINKLSHLRFSL